MSNDAGTGASRRDVLRSAIAGAGCLSFGAAGTASASEVSAGDEIPAPFDSLPTIDDPHPGQRRIAEAKFPARAVPDDGPIPDYSARHTPKREIVVPEWALAAVRWRLSHADPDELDRGRIEEFLMEYAYIREQFVTPDGRDAASVLLAEFTEGNDGD